MPLEAIDDLANAGDARSRSASPPRASAISTGPRRITRPSRTSRSITRLCDTARPSCARHATEHHLIRSRLGEDPTRALADTFRALPRIAQALAQEVALGLASVHEGVAEPRASVATSFGINRYMSRAPAEKTGDPRHALEATQAAGHARCEELAVVAGRVREADVAAEHALEQVEAQGSTSYERHVAIDRRSRSHVPPGYPHSTRFGSMNAMITAMRPARRRPFDVMLGWFTRRILVECPAPVVADRRPQLLAVADDVADFLGTQRIVAAQHEPLLDDARRSRSPRAGCRRRATDRRYRRPHRAGAAPRALRARRRSPTARGAMPPLPCARAVAMTSASSTSLAVPTCITIGFPFSPRARPARIRPVEHQVERRRAHPVEARDLILVEGGREHHEVAALGALEQLRRPPHGMRASLIASTLLSAATSTAASARSRVPSSRQSSAAMMNGGCAAPTGLPKSITLIDTLFRPSMT